MAAQHCLQLARIQPAVLWQTRTKDPGARKATELERMSPQIAAPLASVLMRAAHAPFRMQTPPAKLMRQYGSGEEKARCRSSEGCSHTLFFPSPATGPPANGPPANGAPATGTPAAGLPATGPPFTGLPTLTPTTRPPPSRPPPTRAQPTRAPRTSGPLTRQPAKRTLSPARFDQEPSTSSGPNGSVRKQQLGPAQKKQRSAAAPDGMHLCNRITKLKVGRKTHPVAHWKSTVLEFRHIDVPSDAELSEEEGELEDFVDARDGQSGYVEARERLEKLREDIQLRGGKRFRCPFCGFLAGSTGRKETVARHVGGIPGHGGQRSCWAWATSDDPVSRHEYLLRRFPTRKVQWVMLNENGDETGESGEENWPPAWVGRTTYLYPEHELDAHVVQQHAQADGQQPALEVLAGGDAEEVPQQPAAAAGHAALDSWTEEDENLVETGAGWDALMAGGEAVPENPLLSEDEDGTGGAA
ncbi:uncharacterized protein LOC129596951 [Paramacrobiotus metropolitanus]|uniref:uncharacterized protein LOC129596951 n=1 Tax=Paramacrobiotus metropolitanus TaxID=2943436 RepID=UPI002445727A|nr:uncharacterized protein LOC129596951 [Paramacrobiotus metropolitanus]